MVSACPGMKKLLYRSGRTLQIAALLWMPFSIWEGQIRHSESGAILIFCGSIALFAAGYVLTRLGGRV